MRFGRIVLAVAAFAMLAVSSASAKTVRAGFNDAEIAWVDIASGLAKAKALCKPVFVLFHTDWCPHCKRYRRAFEEDAIVTLSEEFVFVIVDRDHEEETNGRYAPDGGYVPRSVVLDSAGEFQRQIVGPRTDYKYFLNPDDYRDLESFLTRAKGRFDPKTCSFRPS